MADEAIHNSKIVISADASPAAQEADRLAREIDETTAAEFAASHPSQEQPEANKEDQPRGKTTEASTHGSFAPADGSSLSDNQSTKSPAEDGEIEDEEDWNKCNNGWTRDMFIEKSKWATQLIEFTLSEMAKETIHRSRSEPSAQRWPQH